jgi:hypothetical protein
MYKFGFILLLIATIVFACNKQNLCLQYTTNSVTVRFRTYTDSLTLKDTILPYPLIVFDSFANVYPASKKISINLNGHAAKTTAIFYPDSTDLDVFDTLRFYYKPELNFVSKECGYNYNFQIDSITSNQQNIKKIVVLNNSVTSKTNVIHFEIVY